MASCRMCARYYCRTFYLTDTYWIPGVNALTDWGRWAFAKLTEPFTMHEELGRVMQAGFDKLLKTQAAPR